MIIYDTRKLGGYEILLHRTGSALFSYHSLPHALFSGILCAILTQVPVFSAWILSLEGVQGSAYFGGTSFVVGFILVYRMQLANERFRDAQMAYFTLSARLHDMAMQIDSFCPGCDKKSFKCRQQLFRLIRLYHSTAMEEFQGFEFDADHYADHYHRSLKEDEATLLFPERQKPTRIMHWIYMVVIGSRDSFPVGDALLTRVFQLSAECNDAFNSARRIAESPFPFVFAQISFMVIHIWAVLTPLVLAALFNNSYIYPPLVTMFSTWALFAVNEAAAQIENPFEDAANDLPLVYYTIAFNDNISAVEYMQRPTFLRECHFNKYHPDAPPNVPIANCRLSRRFLWDEKLNPNNNDDNNDGEEEVWDGGQDQDEEELPDKQRLQSGRAWEQPQLNVADEKGQEAAVGVEHKHHKSSKKHPFTPARKAMSALKRRTVSHGGSSREIWKPSSARQLHKSIGSDGAYQSSETPNSAFPAHERVPGGSPLQHAADAARSMRRSVSVMLKPSSTHEPHTQDDIKEVEVMHDAPVRGSHSLAAEPDRERGNVFALFGLEKEPVTIAAPGTISAAAVAPVPPPTPPPVIFPNAVLPMTPEAPSTLLQVASELPEEFATLSDVGTGTGTSPDRNHVINTEVDASQSERGSGAGSIYGMIDKGGSETSGVYDINRDLSYDSRHDIGGDETDGLGAKEDMVDIVVHSRKFEPPVNPPTDRRRSDGFFDTRLGAVAASNSKRPSLPIVNGLPGSSLQSLGTGLQPIAESPNQTGIHKGHKGIKLNSPKRRSTKPNSPKHPRTLSGPTSARDGIERPFHSKTVADDNDAFDLSKLRSIAAGKKDKEFDQKNVAANYNTVAGPQAQDMVDQLRRERDMMYRKFLDDAHENYVHKRKLGALRRHTRKAIDKLARPMKMESESINSVQSLPQHGRSRSGSFGSSVASGLATWSAFKLPSRNSRNWFFDKDLKTGGNGIISRNSSVSGTGNESNNHNAAIGSDEDENATITSGEEIDDGTSSALGYESEVKKYHGQSDLSHLEIRKVKSAGNVEGANEELNRATGGIWASIAKVRAKTVGMNSRRADSLKLIESSPTALRMRGEFLRFT